MKAFVDEDKCIGCGLCEQICPVVFEMVGAVAKVKVDPVPENEKDRCREAAESCPVTAITIEE